MVKSIIKELIIVLLLCLAIILVLGILLYEYVPMSKTLPNQVSYTTPEDVKEELAASAEVEESQIIMTYEVDSTDLNNYKRTKDYKPGKANPFSSYETEVVEGGNGNTSTGSTTSGSATNTTNNSSSSTNSNSSSSSSSSSSSGGRYFQDTGTK